MSNQTLITNEVAEEELINRKVLFLINDNSTEHNERMLDIFRKSFKLGITWNIEHMEGFTMFRKTNE